MTRALAASLAALLAVAGCTHLSVPVDGDGLSFAERQERLEALTSWEMRGRLAVSSEDGGFQGSFLWSQEPRTISLTVRGPFGAGVLQVSGSPDELVVRARGDTWTLEDPEIELSALLGWWMPVGSLHAWLIGLPDRAFEAHTEMGPGPALALLQQRLWHLEYPTYQLAGEVLLPRRIDMSHGALAVRLTVDSFIPATDARVLN